MSKSTLVFGAAGLALVALVAWRALGGAPDKTERNDAAVAAIEASPVVVRDIEEVRTLYGALETKSAVVVAADTAGQVRAMHADLGDQVKSGQLIAELDDSEETQGLAEASADMGVARANVEEATVAQEIADRELARLRDLAEEGIVSEAELDQARANQAAKTSALRVARARVQRQGASMRRARIQAKYAEVRASEMGDEESLYVAQRHLDPGDRAAVGDAIVTLVALDPLVAVVHVTEGEYGRLTPGQGAQIRVDAFPDKVFAGSISRVAPAFAPETRQARVEVQVANAERLLKPGMFARVNVTLRTAKKATVVPQAALTSRKGQEGVFVVSEDASSVRWQPVKVGIRSGDFVEISGDAISGQVVTLGHQLVDDGSPVSVSPKEQAP